MFFGRKKPDGKTLLLLDIEQGSVGSALVHLSDEGPRLFGQMRSHTRILPTRDSKSLLHEVKLAARKAVDHAASLAARLRNATGERSGTLHALGQISGAAAFYGAPWGVPSLSSGSPHFVDEMQDAIHNMLDEVLPAVPRRSYSAAGALVGGASRVLPHNTYLLVLAGGEITELIVLKEGAALGYATAPVGRFALARTLRAHGISDAEIQSLVRTDAMGALREPLEAASGHWAREVANAASPLMRQAPVRHVWVVAHGEEGERHATQLAQALEHSDEFSSLFPQGGELRALRGHMLGEHVITHAPAADLTLSLQALYGDALW